MTKSSESNLFKIAMGAAILTCALTARGGDPTPAKQSAKPAPGLEFLEYLGTLESDEETWIDISIMELPTSSSAAASAEKTSASAADRTPVAKSSAKPEAAAKGVGSEKR